MKIFVDESIGIKLNHPLLRENLLQVQLIEVPVQLSTKSKSLMDFLQRKRFWRRRIRTESYTLQEQIQYFVDHLEDLADGNVVLYFYDSTITDQCLLLRLRNLLYPEYLFVPLEVGINRAMLFYLLTNLVPSVLPKLQQQKVNSIEIKERMEYLLSHGLQYVISKQTKPWRKPHKQWNIYRANKKDRYNLIQVINSKTIKPIRRGTLEEIKAQMMQLLDSGYQHYAVSKGIDDEWSYENVTCLVAEEQSLPINVPYIHFFSIPT